MVGSVKQDNIGHWMSPESFIFYGNIYEIPAQTALEMWPADHADSEAGWLEVS